MQNYKMLGEKLRQFKFPGKDSVIYLRDQSILSCRQMHFVEKRITLEFHCPILVLNYMVIFL